MREFNTAVKQAELDETGVNHLDFVVDGEVCRAQRPKPSQIAFLMGVTSRYMNEREQMGGILNFLDSLLDDQSAHHLRNRLLDPSDDFGVDEMMEIIMFLAEEWTGRPTNRLSGSTPSQPNTGQPSMPVTPAPTSSNYQHTGY